jgi:ATP-dependent DNA helicase RecQ
MMLVEEKDALREQLKEIFGYSQFRGNQEIIIRNLMEGRNTFVIMPTGAGKSLCYQLPAMMYDGLAIVISPLIALMKNQVDQLNAYGINARFLNSTLSKGEITRLKKDCINGVIKLLYVAPESKMMARAGITHQQGFYFGQPMLASAFPGVGRS